MNTNHENLRYLMGDEDIIPTIALGDQLLPPQLCDALFDSGKFLSLIPANFWIDQGNGDGYCLHHNLKHLRQRFIKGYCTTFKITPAYNESELWLMLPKEIRVGNHTFHVLAHFTPGVKGGPGVFNVGYGKLETISVGPFEKFKALGIPTSVRYMAFGKSQVEAMGRLLLNLIELQIL